MREIMDNDGKKHTVSLLPFPFCGTEPSMHTVGNRHTKSRKVVIKCPGCRIQRTDAAIRNNFDWLFEVAAKNWNQRQEAA